MMNKVTIETGLGKVTGTEENGIRMFRGIPYAITERFEMPKPYPAWDEFDATGIIRNLSGATGSTTVNSGTDRISRTGNLLNLR